MKKYRCSQLAIILFGLLLGGLWQTARAQNRPFGLGLVLGSPSGITVKYWQSQRKAIDGAIAWSDRREERFLVYGDYLVHDFNLLDESRTPVYYGIGGRLVLEERAGLGVRIPLGITHLFSAEPFDIFLEIVPVLELAPDVQLDVDGGIGARYYFRQTNRN